MNNDSDTNLVKRFKRGEVRAFRRIYDLYHKPIYAIALKYLKSEALAEDAVHDIFIKLWDYRGKLDANKPVKGFLFTTAKNHVLNMIRDSKRARQKNKAYGQLRSISKNTTLHKLTLENYQQVFDECLKKLPDGKRKVFELKMNQNLSNQDIADRLDVSVNTIKSQYYKASKFIKEQLNKQTDLDLA